MFVLITEWFNEMMEFIKTYLNTISLKNIVNSSLANLIYLLKF